GPDPPGPEPMVAVAGLVSRVIEIPPTVKVTEALPTTLPVVFDANVTEHWPAVVPGLAPVLVTTESVAPFPLVRVTVGLVPSGAFTNPSPPPRFRFTVTVNV